MAEFAAASDIKGIVKLVTQMAEETPNFPAKSFDPTYFTKSLDILINHQDTAVIKEASTDSVVGLLIVGISFWPFSKTYKTASDILMYVDKEHRGNGVAGKLISRAKDWARSKNADVMTFGNSAGITPESTYQRMLDDFGFKLRGGLYSCAVDL